MLVSGGKILAIDQVYTDNRTISGDGVQKPLVVNTDVIATTSSVSSVSSILNQNITNVSSTLNQEITNVSSVLNQNITNVSADLENYYTKAETTSAINDALEGVIKHETEVSAQDIAGNIIAVTRTVKEDGTVVFELSAKPEITDTNIIGINGISAEQREDLAWVISYTGKSGNIYSAATPNLDIYEDENHQWWISAAAYPDVSNFLTSAEGYEDEALVLKNNQWVPADDVFATDEDIRNLSATVANTYLSASEFNTYSADVDKRLDDLEEIAEQYTTTDSAHFETTYETVLNTSAKWNEVSAFSALSGNFMQTSKLESTVDNKLSGYGGSAFYYPQAAEYSGGDGIKVENNIISISAKYLSANALDNLSGKWESVYDTVESNSARWNEVSAYFATSGQFVTSALEDFTAGLANVLVKDDENNVTWSGVDLTDLGKMYNISSITPEFVSAGISADEQNNPIYVVSAATPEQVATPDISGYGLSAWKDTTDNTYKVDVQLSGISGVSAEYDSQTNQWLISVQGGPAYANYQAITSPDAGAFVPTYYSQLYNVGNGITLTNNKLYVAPGLWHVTIYARITNDSLSNEYYDTTVECNSVKNVVQFDNSYQHSEYVNLDVDINNDSTGDRQLDITVSNVPSDAAVVIEQLQIHKVVTGNVAHEGGSTYLPGDGITIDNYQINVNAGSGLAINDNTNKLDVQAGSGIYIDQNNKLSVKLGKGLAFSADGDIISIETNTEVNDVVETVEKLKKELDGKLTTNMNISDAKVAGNPWEGDDNVNNLAASFFTIPLQHNISTATEISFFTTQGLGQSDSQPLMLGILEYNFDYFVSAQDAPNGVSARTQTQWIADTGPIWLETRDVNHHLLTDGAGRYTYKLNNVTQVSANDVTGTDGTVYHNEFGPTMRSDRAYYLILYSHSPNSYKSFLCDEGYADGINNTDPAISFRKPNTQYIDPDGISRNINSDYLALVKSQNLPFTISGMEYWDRHTQQTDQTYKMKRPYVMIRNPRL